MDETVVVDDPGVPFVVTLRFVAVDEVVWVCAEVSMAERDPSQPAGFTSTVTRTVDLPGLIVAARASLPVLRAVDAVPLVRGHPLGDDHYRRVAEVYRAALIGHEPPARAVAVQLAGGAEKWRTASRWVTGARARGFLGPTTPGRKGG